MKKFKKLFSIILAVGTSILSAGRVFAGGYKAQFCIGEHYRKGSGDFYAQFDVENEKGVSTYFVDILKHSSAPIQDEYICRLCQYLLTQCHQGSIELGKILEIELTKNSYLELFNLSKIIKSRKIKDTDKKIEAFKSLIPKILTLYGISFNDECYVI